MTDKDMYFTCNACGAINEPGRIIRKHLAKPSYYQGREQKVMLKLICDHCGKYRKFVSPDNEEYQLIAEDE